MILISPAFSHNEQIPSRFTCDGEDINPPLQIVDVPSSVVSLVLIVDDPDAPAGDWVHWLVWNINPEIKEIAENTVPSNAIEGTTDFKRTGWGGPCPPSGTHRYFFKLYALDTFLDLQSTATKNDVLNALEGHVLAKTELVGLYKRT